MATKERYVKQGPGNRTQRLEEKIQLHWTPSSDSARMKEPWNKMAFENGRGLISKPAAVNYKTAFMTPQTTGPGLNSLQICNCSALCLEGPKHDITSLFLPNLFGINIHLCKWNSEFFIKLYPLLEFPAEVIVTLCHLSIPLLNESFVNCTFFLYSRYN